MRSCHVHCRENLHAVSCPWAAAAGTTDAGTLVRLPPCKHDWKFSLPPQRVRANRLHWQDVLCDDTHTPQCRVQIDGTDRQTDGQPTITYHQHGGGASTRDGHMYAVVVTKEKDIAGLLK